MCSSVCVRGRSVGGGGGYGRVGEGWGSHSGMSDGGHRGICAVAAVARRAVDAAVAPPPSPLPPPSLPSGAPADRPRRWWGGPPSLRTALAAEPVAAAKAVFATAAPGAGGKNIVVRGKHGQSSEKDPKSKRSERAPRSRVAT